MFIILEYVVCTLLVVVASAMVFVLWVAGITVQETLRTVPKALSSVIEGTKVLALKAVQLPSMRDQL